MSNIVAIGGGQAGFSFVQKLRSLGCNQKITLVCGEDMVPYQRPPLSKKFLLGEMSKQQLLLRPESYYDDKKINLIIQKCISQMLYIFFKFGKLGPNGSATKLNPATASSELSKTC